jgi:hypothetical protein
MEERKSGENKENLDHTRTDGPRAEQAGGDRADELQSLGRSLGRAAAGHSRGVFPDGLRLVHGERNVLIRDPFFRDAVRLVRAKIFDNIVYKSKYFVGLTNRFRKRAI